jgi:hypothetical protein
VQQQPPRGFRRFLATPPGKAFLIALTVLVVFASYVYVETLLAIPVFLIFGLAVPIWAGLKRPRYLALSGLVVLLLVAPISTLVITQDIRTPIGAACSVSNTTCPGSSANALLQNASVTPYTGTTSTNFTWTVVVFPANAPKGNSTVWNISLYISTCPGATSTTPPSWCSAGYPFTQITQKLNLSNTSRAVALTFHDMIGSNGIWDWQMGVYTLNSSTHKPWYQTLVGDPTYNGIEGPVVGDYATTYGALVPTIYFDDLLFLGGSFYIVLLVYILFKSRERRRKEVQKRAAGPVPPSAGTGPEPTTLPSPTAPPTSKAAAGAGPPERTCPNCSAVVYENETKCWKCGADLPAGVSAPLPSGKKG